MVNVSDAVVLANSVGTPKGFENIGGTVVPVAYGLDIQHQGRPILDRDKQVQESLRLFFDTFRRVPPVPS
jgi:hypothetical protein